MAQYLGRMAIYRLQKTWELDTELKRQIRKYNTIRAARNGTSIHKIKPKGESNTDGIAYNVERFRQSGESKNRKSTIAMRQLKSYTRPTNAPQYRQL